jgi:hypothetical protein
MTVARFQDAPGRPSGPVRLPELSRPLIAGQRGVSPEFNYTFVPHGWNAATWPPYAHAGTHRDTPFHSAAGPETIAPQPLALCLDPASVVNLPRRTRPPAHRRAPRPGRSPLHRRRKHLAPHRLAPPRLQARALSRRPSPPRRRTRRAVGRPPRVKNPRRRAALPRRGQLGLTPAPGPFSLAWFNPRAGPARSAANAATGGAKLTLAARSTTDWPAVVRALPARGAAPTSSASPVAHRPHAPSEMSAAFRPPGSAN